jgi:DNA-directed RNA polymerase specialized sigma24 family protein
MSDGDFSEPAEDANARLLSDLTKMAAGDEGAFERIWPRSKRYLSVILANKVKSSTQLEDILQEVARKAWQSRASFDVRGVRQWFSYLRTAGERCLYDLRNADHGDASLEAVQASGVQFEGASSEQALIHEMTRSDIYDLADELWLWKTELDQHARRRRLITAQLFYVDRRAWQDVCRLAGGDLFPLTRDELDRWLSDPSVGRALAYSQLYLCSEALYEHLLGCDGWTPGEKMAIEWHYRHGLLPGQILVRMQGVLDEQVLNDLLARCVAKYPFLEEMARLQERLQHVPQLRQCLTEPDLWKRLAFQYDCHDDVSHRGIRERTAPPADRAGYRLTMAVLNSWLSNHRIYTELVKHATGRRSIR